MSRPAPQTSHSLLRRFRDDRKRQPLHPRELTVVVAVGLHLAFLPWALGTVHPWAQITSLALATVGFAVALLPRGGVTSYELGVKRSAVTPPNQELLAPNRGPTPRPLNKEHLTPNGESNQPLKRLVRFPLFWIGLLLLAYVTVQALNPSWVWERNATSWWLRRVNDIPWLPTSVDAPFDRFNVWRQLIIYASVWLTICTVWIGFTRRRSLELLLTVVVANALVLAVTGFICRFFRPWEFLLWFEEPMPGASTFASFIYKNHAGAWLALLATACLYLAAFHHERSVKQMARSSPALLFVLAAVVLCFAEIATLSRGGMALLLGFLLVAAIAYILRRAAERRHSTTHPFVPLSLGVLVVAAVGFSAAQLDYRKVEARFNSLFQGQGKDISITQRIAANAASMEMLDQHWPRGTGAGGFRHLYPVHIQHHPVAYNGGRLFWQHAHNDWLQIPIELGAAGSVLLLLGGGYWLIGLFRRRFWRSTPVLLLVLGLAQTPLHATFDFPLQNPAVLITWCALATLALRRLDMGDAMR